MGSIVILSKTESNQPTVPSPPHANSLIFGTCLNISIAWPGPPSVRSKTCLGLRSHWNFCINLAPWLPPDLGLRNTRIGATPGEGIGFRQKGLSLVSSWSLPSLARLVGAPTFFLCFFLLGEFFRLDLKLLFLGTLTIQEGGTMSWKNTRGLIVYMIGLWQYGLWSFQAGVTKLVIFLHKNQHTQKKLLNFKLWIHSVLSKIGHHFSNEKI